MLRTRRHKVFVSYHHRNDKNYRNKFDRLFGDVYDILDSRSVEIGDIHPCLNVDEIARRIRDGYLRDSTVTVVLIGKDTWRRKHIDWEIAATIRKTGANDRGGLIGIFLPSHPSFGEDEYDEYTIPPRLYYNVEAGYAKLFDWSESPSKVADWIDNAYRRRRTVNPDNSSVRFAKNWKGKRWYPRKRQARPS